MGAHVSAWDPPLDGWFFSTKVCRDWCWHRDRVEEHHPLPLERAELSSQPYTLPNINLPLYFIHLSRSVSFLLCCGEMCRSTGVFFT